jgi:type VI protein secretion system component VasF
MRYSPGERLSLGSESAMNLIEAIKAVPDYRQKRGIRHPLWLILIIILFGSCTGYWGYKPLVDFTKKKSLDS